MMDFQSDNSIEKEDSIAEESILKGLSEERGRLVEDNILNNIMTDEQ